MLTALPLTRSKGVAMKISGQLTVDDLPRICPLLCRQTNPRYGEDQTRVVEVGGVRFGNGHPVVIGGPCAVESHDQTLAVARAVKRAGADMLRGGAYKPRTSPHDFQGTGVEGLCILRIAREETGLPIVTEVMDTRLVEQVAEYADMLQIGSRNMQNYPLLAEVGRTGKPVLLKRGMAASLANGWAPPSTSPSKATSTLFSASAALRPLRPESTRAMCWI